MLLAQILAVIIFIIMFIEIVRERFPRYLVTLVAGGCTILVVFLAVMHSPSAVWTAFSLDSMAEPLLFRAATP